MFTTIRVTFNFGSIMMKGKMRENVMTISVQVNPFIYISLFSKMWMNVRRDKITALFSYAIGQGWVLTQ